MCAELASEELGEQIPGSGHRRWSGPISLQETLAWLLIRDVALWTFVDTLEDVYGPCLEVEAARDAVRSGVAEPVLTRDQRRELHRLCEGIVCRDAARLFRHSAGDPPRELLHAAPDNLRAVLNELEELQVRPGDGLLPLIVFVEHLAAQQPPETAERLQSWTEAYVSARAPLASALQTVRDDLPAATDPDRGYLIVELTVDGLDPGRYLVSILFQRDAEQPWSLRSPDDISHTEDSVRELIDEARNRQVVTDTASDALVVEFMLPTALINRPVDQWKVGLAGVSLGVQYPVVVRSLDRIRKGRGFRPKWREKWRRLAIAEPGTLEVHTVAADPARPYEWLADDPEDTPDRLFVRFDGETAPVCLLLENTPDPADCRRMLAVLQAGVPVMLWSRRPDVDMRRGLSTLLPIRMKDLPWRVHEFRRDAVSNGADRDHLARHLVLLWDDADRIPEADLPLENPA